MTRNYVYVARLCIHGQNENVCRKCYAEYEAWLTQQDNEAYMQACKDEGGDS